MMQVSMTREEAIKHITTWMYATTDLPPVQVAKAFDMALAALRPVSRERVEKVWRGEWQMVSNGSGVCSECHRQDKIDPLAKFCRYCGARMEEGKL